MLRRFRNLLLKKTHIKALVKVKKPSQILRSFQKTTRDINNCLDMHPLLRNWQMEKRHHSNLT
jgi:hypothetical protein